MTTLKEEIAELFLHNYAVVDVKPMEVADQILSLLRSRLDSFRIKLNAYLIAKHEHYSEDSEVNFMKEGHPYVQSLELEKFILKEITDLL